MILKSTMEAFKTTDGRLFPDPTDAQQHQIGLDLEKIFDNSEGRYYTDEDQETITAFCKKNVGALRFAFSQLEVTG